MTLQQAVDSGLTATEQAELAKVVAAQTFEYITYDANKMPSGTATGPLSTSAHGSRVNAIKVKLAKAHGYSQ